MVFAAFAFARELLGSTRRAVLAAAILALSPFMLDAERDVSQLRVRARRCTSSSGRCCSARCAPTKPHRSCRVSGLVLGAAFLTRPYDAVLFALAVRGLHRRDPPPRPPRGGKDRRVGRARRRPRPRDHRRVQPRDDRAARSGSRSTVQSGGYSTFGWGVRSIAPDTPIAELHHGRGVRVHGDEPLGAPDVVVRHLPHLRARGLSAPSSSGAPTGRLRVPDRPRRRVPVGYLAWWASSLTTNGALGARPALLPPGARPRRDPRRARGRRSSPRRRRRPRRWDRGRPSCSLRSRSRRRSTRSTDRRGHVALAHDGQVRRGLRQRRRRACARHPGAAAARATSWSPIRSWRTPRT